MLNDSKKNHHRSELLNRSISSEEEHDLSGVVNNERKDYIRTGSDEISHSNIDAARVEHFHGCFTKQPRNNYNCNVGSFIVFKNNAFEYSTMSFRIGKKTNIHQIEKQIGYALQIH